MPRRPCWSRTSATTSRKRERGWFPKVRAGLGRKQLQEIGVLLEEARRKAPTKPSQPSALKKTIEVVFG
jgi:hypothetical protein